MIIVYDNPDIPGAAASRESDKPGTFRCRNHHDHHTREQLNACEAFRGADVQGMTDREYADHVARVVTPVDPPAAWLSAWMAGYLSGYANGHDDGVDVGYGEYAAVLGEALSPIKKAAVRGIDMMMARRAWENQRRADHGQGPLTGPLERGGDREPYGGGGGQDA